MYYFFTQKLTTVDYMVFGGPSELSSKRLWVKGIPFDEPFPKDTFYVQPCIGEGDLMPDFFDSSVPVMSDKLLNRLRELGVDNIEAYPVIIKQKDSSNSWDNYYAINVIGSMDVIDREKSDIDEDDEDIFHSVFIDEDKAKDVLCTRVYGGPAQMLIHETVAKPLMENSFACIRIVKSEEFDMDVR